MIDVDNLSRRYHSVRAVDRLSFQVGRGEIVGFLGPNGAGKTTSMRMLSTFLAPSSGRATLGGHDIIDDPVAVRRRVGYLPEGVPLYPEMRVGEYLDYRARLKDVPRSGRRSSVARVVERCGLVEVERRVLGHLSKGFRQRVGLADAMVHDPDILILDEPTSGLDPIQIREVRDLIRELGDRHTILLSTHIMSEVEAVCGRVLMIVGGRLAVDAPLDQLRAGGSIVVEVRGAGPKGLGALRSVPGVARVALEGRAGDVDRFEVDGAPGADLGAVREAIAARVLLEGWGLRSLEPSRSTLEERFVRAVHEASFAPPATPAESTEAA